MNRSRTQIKAVMAGFIPAVTLLAMTAPAHADLKLCNRMSYVAEAAIGIDDKAATATRGWFRIDPAACRVVVQGTLAADRILLHARALGLYGASPIPQNGSDTLCVAADNFVIAAAGSDINKRINVERRCRDALNSSCPGLTRASTASLPARRE